MEPMKHVKRLFKVLVVAGTALAVRSAWAHHDQGDTGGDGGDDPKLAFDGNAAKECASPQCKCWLG